MNIEKTLAERFAAPVQENYKRRIIFWHDPDREFAEEIDALTIPSVKILKLTGSNNFAAKKLLLKDDTESNYLVYNPLSYKRVEDNWLLDIELQSESFRADMLSIRMQQFDTPSTPQFRNAMREYAKFFENKERVAKLNALGSVYDTVSRLHLDILAVLTHAKAADSASIISAVLMAGLDAEQNESLIAIQKFGSLEMFWELVAKFTGFEVGEEISLPDLAAHIIFTTLSLTMPASALKSYAQYISEAHAQYCYSLVNDWIHSGNDDAFYDIAREVEERFTLDSKFDALELTDLLSSECLPFINECILRRFMNEISENVIKCEDILAAVEKRRTLKWYKRVQYYYDGLYFVALMQQFYQENIGGFHIAEYETLWNEYCNNYCKFDYYYRMFLTAFGKSLKSSTTVLEDLYKNVADYVEKLYKNWFLAGLSKQWTDLTAEQFETSAELPAIRHQADFYTSFVRPITAASNRVFVIVSDAMRYEVGVELTKNLLSATKGTAKISAVQATFPTKTEFGMAALLPHKKLQYTSDFKVLCDGFNTDSTPNREKILNREHSGNIAVTYKQLLAMKQAERRELVSGAKAVYIYHNLIDTVGENYATEDQVFEACEQTVAELTNLVRLLTNDLSAANILITADHGFLYSYKELEAWDKLEKKIIDGEILSADHRYAVAKEEVSADHLIKIPLKHLGSDLFAFTPLANIRIKKPGGTVNYVHGGISLQESVVPVIEFKNIRSTSKKYVETKKAEVTLISQSRKISNSIFSLDFYQKEAVGNKISPAEYEVYMADEAGNVLSDKQIIIADKKSENGSERVFRTRFTLKGANFDKTQTYYLFIAEKDSLNITEKIEFSIDIAFVNDFDF